MIESIRAALAPSGLNLVGVASTAAWDATQPDARKTAALAPGARSIVVVANGGRALWSALLDDLRAHPEHLTATAHPVDAYARRQTDALAPLLAGARHRWFHAAAEADVHIDFRVLGQLAGIGADSRLGLLLHPEYGPWIGLRAACFVDAELAPTSAAPSACVGCAAPCAAACPGGAFPDGRWAVDPCVAFHAASPDCASRCFAREACPVGAAHRYTDAQYRYHYDRFGGRRALRDALGVHDDPHEGEGPHWGVWRARVDVTGAR